MQKFYFLSIALIIYFSKELQVYCERRELESPYKANENQADVEKLVFDYAKRGNIFKSCKYVVDGKPTKPCKGSCTLQPRNTKNSTSQQGLLEAPIHSSKTNTRICYHINLHLSAFAFGVCWLLCTRA